MSTKLDSRGVILPVVLGTLLLAIAFAGCLADDERDPEPDSPRASGQPETIVFRGEVPAGWRSPFGPTEASRHRYVFPVTRDVGHLELALSYRGSPQAVDAALVDERGRVQCQATALETPKTCSTPVPRGLIGPVDWIVDVGPGILPLNPGTPYEVTVILHPRGSLVLGDPAAGTDPAIRFRTADTGVKGFEPTLGLLADGTIFVQELLATMRSNDDGRTWENVAPVTTSQETLDPMLRVDPWFGRVYVNQLTGACSILAWSDDAGATWTTNPAACGTPVNDHQKLAVGPSPLPDAPGPAVYYAYWDFVGGVHVSRSYDGGLTFTTTRVISPPGGPTPGYTGPIEADREGNVYVSFYTCGEVEGVGVGVSHDHGLTFRAVQAAEVPGSCTEPDPGIGVDSAGNVYLAFNRPDGTYLVSSTDHGMTWSPPLRISPAGLGSFMHVALVAGDAGKVAVAYRATPDDDAAPDAVDGWARWYLYVSFVEDAAGPAPRVRTALATPPGDRVQVGPICQGFYPPCLDDSRNLGDFIDIAVGPDGRVYAAYDDGCDDPCETPADSRSALGKVAILEEGPRLYSDRAPWATVHAAHSPRGVADASEFIPLPALMDSVVFGVVGLWWCSPLGPGSTGAQASTATRRRRSGRDSGRCGRSPQRARQ